MPLVAVVDGPVVVEAGIGEQGRVQGVVGVVVAEHHVGHLLGLHTQLTQRVKDQGAMPGRSGEERRP
jgi:hypothetical protein